MGEHASLQKCLFSLTLQRSSDHVRRRGDFFLLGGKGARFTAIGGKANHKHSEEQHTLCAKPIYASGNSRVNHQLLCEVGVVEARDLTPL